MPRPRYVIVGGGPAASAAAAAMRESGFDGAIVVISGEPVPPYERPPLSKDFLTGETNATELELRARQWFTANDVELRLGTHAERLDVPASDVILVGGERVHYDRLLLSTGGSPRRFPGVNSDRIMYLRDLADAEQLAKRLLPGEPLVVLGGGFIGCEVAASARKLGVEVTILEMADVPLQRALGIEAGRVIQDIHRDNGVTVRTGAAVEAADAGPGGLRLETAAGAVECSTLLVALGLVPNTGLVAGTDMAVDEATGGIVVDRFCRTTVPNVFAAGDVTAHDHPLYGSRIHVEHHDNAIKQGAVAGRNMVGVAHQPYDDLHYFWSDQYDHHLQAIGRAEGCDEVVLRGSLDQRSFAVFSLAAGRVRSVLALDRPKDLMAGKKLVASGAEVTADQIRDESVNLKRLATPRGAGR